jgi:deazaflavin-dependent oxidoreductase (nitroreductase family)
MTTVPPRDDDPGMEPSVITSSAPSKPSLVHRISVASMGLARPLAGRRMIPLYAILEHRGRTSGIVRRTPVVARRTPDGFIIPMPFGASTQWTLNVLAAGEATIVWKGREWHVQDPRVVGIDEAGAALGTFRRAAGRLGIEQYLAVREG